jgi:hypothetical protein
MVGSSTRIWGEEDGVLSFEWVLLTTLLTLGIVGGLAAARDAIIDELGDTAQVMLAVDQSFHVALPLAAAVHAANGSASSDSTFTDAAAFTDCGRPEGFVLVGQPGEDDAFPDEFFFP